MANNFSKSIDHDEIAKFSAISEEWWDASGKFAPLHKFNPVRIKYITDKSIEHFRTGADKPLSGLKLLDIGCGGGLLAEPMARLGADVTAIDASEKNIKIASSHADNYGLKINYQCTSVEELAESDNKFDIILNMEVVEHVADVDSFLESSGNLLKKDGLMFIATLNKTVKSYALAIIGAEYILKWLPKGTHDWNKFLKPSQIEEYLSNNGAKLLEIQGVSYNPLTDQWKLSDDITVNYMMLFGK